MCVCMCLYSCGFEGSGLVSYVRVCDTNQSTVEQRAYSS